MDAHNPHWFRVRTIVRSEFAVLRWENEKIAKF
jgi:hypothetical protein